MVLDEAGKANTLKVLATKISAMQTR